MQVFICFFFSFFFFTKFFFLGERDQQTQWISTVRRIYRTWQKEKLEKKRLSDLKLQEELQRAERHRMEQNRNQTEQEIEKISGSDTESDISTVRRIYSLEKKKLSDLKLQEELQRAERHRMEQNLNQSDTESDMESTIASGNSEAETELEDEDYYDCIDGDGDEENDKDKEIENSNEEKKDKVVKKRGRPKKIITGKKQANKISPKKKTSSISSKKQQSRNSPKKQPSRNSPIKIPATIVAVAARPKSPTTRATSPKKTTSPKKRTSPIKGTSPKNIRKSDTTASITTRSTFNKKIGGKTTKKVEGTKKYIQTKYKGFKK